MTFYCNCNEECFGYINASTGYMVYKCNQIIEPKKENTEWKLGCDYSNTIQMYTNITKPEEPEYKIPETRNPKTKTEMCTDLANLFLLTQKFTTFQELENVSGRKFDGDREHIMNYVYSFINLK